MSAGRWEFPVAIDGGGTKVVDVIVDTDDMSFRRSADGSLVTDPSELRSCLAKWRRMRNMIGMPDAGGRWTDRPKRLPDDSKGYDPSSGNPRS